MSPELSNSRNSVGRNQEFRMLSRAPNDVVTVTRIDHLARSTFDLFGIVKRIVEAGAQFSSLAEPWADTSNGAGRLMIAALGGVAEVERDLICTRTSERRTGGRPPKLTEDDLDIAGTLVINPDITVADAADRLGVSPATLYRHMPAARSANTIAT